jgi:DNA-directed RNA polymerase specialized sigma24 family protein
MSTDEPEATGARITAPEAIVASGDPRALATIKQLFESGFVDGLVRRLQRGWSLLDRAAIEDAVADAVLALYDALAAGRRVGSSEAYVFKVAGNRAQVLHRKITDRDDHHDFDVAEDSHLGSDGPGYVDLRQEALRVARRLLPRLGQTNIERVMGMVFDAVEADVADISPSEIAEALGLSSTVVRQSLHRGFQRLERIALEEGLQLNIADVLEDDAALLDDEEDDDDDDQ